MAAVLATSGDEEKKDEACAEACGAGRSARAVHSRLARHRKARHRRMQCTAAVRAAARCRAGHTCEGIG